MIRSMLTVLAAAAALAACIPASAQNYPAKAVRLIVPFPPGGSTDTLARALSLKLAESWGQQVVIDNRPGASGRPRAVNRVPACGMRTSASRDARRCI